MAIKLLDEDTIQKIAAGEVIESPVSIVKELVENSIDANAKNIYVEIEAGGKDLIFIKDDGDGIEEDDIELAFKRHSTSKIKSFEDLYSIHSLGFRGEALASIVAVSKLTCSSKVHGEKSGIKVRYENSKLVEKTRIGMNRGTNFEIRDLFYNIPVRRNFLKSDSSEANKISQLMYSLAIGNSDISFSYVKDKRMVFKTNGDGLENTLYNLYGSDYVEKLHSIDLDDGNYKIHGVICDNRFYRGNRSMQYIYVNNRYVEAMEITNTIERAYQDMLPTSRYPAFQLFIETDPSNIDINIHPNKQKIAFFNIESFLILLESEVVKTLIGGQDSFKISEEKESGKIDLDDFDAYERILACYNDSTENPDLIKEVDKTNKTTIDLDLGSRVLTSEGDSEKDYERDDLPDFPKDKKSEKYSDDFLSFSYEDDYLEEVDGGKKAYLDSLNEETNIIENTSMVDEDKADPLNNFSYVGVFSSYILFENILNNSLIFLDYQAANERILYDKYLDQFEKKEILSQRLIDPIILKLNVLEMDNFKKKIEIFEDLFFEIDLIDEDSIAVRSVPSEFIDYVNEQTIRNLIDISNLSDRDEYIRKILTISNRRAYTYKIKNDKNYNMIFIETLFKSKKPYISPLGRPIIFEVAKEDIDRKFLRW